MDLPMEQAVEVTNRIDNLRNIAAKAWPNGEIKGVCVRCGKEWDYGWDDAVVMMSQGLPRHCGKRIDLR